MSTKFFASVRRNQKQWMVVVTVLSMVSFLFFDDFLRGKGPISPFGGGLMVGCLCAAGLCIVGYPRGKTLEFGLGGLVVGFFAGYVGFGAASTNKPLVRSAMGNLTREDFERLAQRRQKVNHFIQLMARKSQSRHMGFGGIDYRELVVHRMLLADAEKMGVRISDESVNDFLKQLSQGRVTRQEFSDNLREARCGETELFECLKLELAAQLVVELTRPPAFIPPIPQGLQQYVQESPRFKPQTPYELWSAFEKLNVKQSLQAVAVKVSDFKSRVGEPTDQELALFFEKYKGLYWTDDARPGFREMPRVQLAYLTANFESFEKFEKGSEPTDVEIAEYYEKNKDRYRAPLPKDSTAPKMPDDDVPPEPGSSGVKKTDEAVVEPAKDSKAEQPSNGDDKKLTDGDVKPEQKSDTTPVEKQKDESKSNCGDELNPKPAAEKTEQPEAPVNSTDSSNDPKKDSDTVPPSPGESLKAPAPPANDKASKETTDDGAQPKYRELNEELKSQIRDEILSERAFIRIAGQLDKCQEFMINLGLEYDSTTDPVQKKEKAKSIAEQLQMYATEQDLEYHETSPMTYEELSSERIGRALENRGRSPVAREVFITGDRGDPRLPLYVPRRADLNAAKSAFAFWKIGDFPSYIGDLKDNTVRAKVVDAWKFDQARSVAEKRAQELAIKAKSEGNDMPAALSGESITGEKSDPAITIIPTDPFSWLTAGQSVPGAQQGPMISIIPLLDGVGNGFMQTVFDELQDGEIGVAPDEARSVFYVVKVMNRETSQNDDGGLARQERQQKFMKEEFASRFYPLLKNPYQTLAQYPQNQIDQIWERNFEKNHQVEWEEEIAPARSRRK